MTFQQFLEEYKKLKNSFPRLPNHIHESENSDNGDYLAQCKNAYFCFEDSQCENITYLFDSFKSTNCCDGDYIIQSQNIYDSVDVADSNSCSYLSKCARLYDSHFCFDCADSNNLFGCVHLSLKEYCIYNKQYEKEEYLKRVFELKKRSIGENLLELKDLLKRYPVTQTTVYQSENCDYGNQVFYSKNLYLCFDSAYSQDSAYLYDSHHNKNSFDLTQTHWCEKVYECIDSFQCHNSFNLNYCSRLLDAGYCENCSDSNHLFGCYDLTGQEYCLLNKKYSKEEYEKMVKEIMQRV